MLRLAFARRGNATIVRRCRYTLPLQVLSPLALDDGVSYLLLLNPTGGVLAGDRLRSEITLEEKTHVCVSTPSATRVYRSSGASAEMETILRIGPNAALEYLPDHVIPHAGSSLRQVLRVEMDAGSRGIFFDGFAAGRIALGERWRFREFDSRSEIFLRGKPVLASRTLIHGTASSSLPDVVIPSGKLPFGSSSTEALGRMAGYAYSGSLLLIADEFENWSPLLAALRSALDEHSGIFGGASLLAHSGCSVRYLAASAIEFHAATLRLWTLARRHLLGLPPLSLRKY